MTAAVVFSLFNDIITSANEEQELNVVPVDSFYERLVKLKVRRGSYDVPNLS